MMTRGDSFGHAARTSLRFRLFSSPNTMQITDKMNAQEKRATVSLATIFALRMFGMFSILPVLALYAKEMPGGSSAFLIGLALGIDGLTQALLQVPFGLLSDRIGRKKVIYLGLCLFALGSFIAASGHDIYTIIFGRLVQGTGAVAAAIIALLADLTREEHRAKAMATIGMGIGVTFGASMVLGPMLAHHIGVSGIFAMTGVLALLALLVVKHLVPDPAHSCVHADAETIPTQIKAVLAHPELQRLDAGIFTLHAIMRGLFVVIPLALVSVGELPPEQHWHVYLPIMAIGFFAAVPAIIIAEKYAKMKPVFTSAVALVCLSTLIMANAMTSFTGLVAGLFAFFVAFNLLEATLPSLVSKIAPAGSKGTAIGVYNTCQFLGLFIGGALGGYLMQNVGATSVFYCATVLGLIWLGLAFTMAPPPAVRTRLFPVQVENEAHASLLVHELLQLHGILDAAVSVPEGVAYLKVRMGAEHAWDEQGALQLLNRGREHGFGK